MPGLAPMVYSVSPEHGARSRPILSSVIFVSMDL
jgi:hypothetical protein